MTQLANDTDLKYAEIDLCLFHVNSGVLLQLWKGVIQNFTSDGTPIFPVTCSDGFFQIMNQYPERQTEPPVLEELQRRRELSVGLKGSQRSGGDGGGRRSRKLRLLPRIDKRMPGSRHGSVLRRAPGRPTGRRHQGRFNRLPRLRTQHSYRDFDCFGHDLGSGIAPKSGATAVETHCSPSWPRP